MRVVVVYGRSSNLELCSVAEIGKVHQSEMVFAASILGSHKPPINSWNEDKDKPKKSMSDLNCQKIFGKSSEFLLFASSFGCLSIRFYRKPKEDIESIHKPFSHKSVGLILIDVR